VETGNRRRADGRHAAQPDAEGCAHCRSRDAGLPGAVGNPHVWLRAVARPVAERDATAVKMKCVRPPNNRAPIRLIWRDLEIGFLRD
jgi:hypothetical protein